MKKISKFDKIVLIAFFLLVVAIFILAFIIKSNGGQYVMNPYLYAQAHNLTNPFIPTLNLPQ